MHVRKPHSKVQFIIVSHGAWVHAARGHLVETFAVTLSKLFMVTRSKFIAVAPSKLVTVIWSRHGHSAEFSHGRSVEFLHGYSVELSPNFSWSIRRIFHGRSVEISRGRSVKISHGHSVEFFMVARSKFPVLTGSKCLTVARVTCQWRARARARTCVSESEHAHARACHACAPPRSSPAKSLRCHLHLERKPGLPRSCIQDRCSTLQIHDCLSSLQA